MSERLDHELLTELEMIMEEDFGALLETYLRDSQARFFDVTEAWEAGDLERLRRSVHSLKGASSNIGALALAGLCSDLESLAREGRSEAVPDALVRLRSELGEVQDAVQAIHTGRQRNGPGQ